MTKKTHDSVYFHRANARKVNMYAKNDLVEGARKYVRIFNTWEAGSMAKFSFGKGTRHVPAFLDKAQK